MSEAGGMAVSTVVVFEKRQRLTPELQRQCTGESVRIRVCCSLTEVRPILHDAPHSILVVDLEAALGKCLQFLGQMVSETPFVPVIAIGSHQTAEWEWAIRELGVVEFVPRFESGEDLARLCRKQWMPSQDQNREF
jgi:DNA-binding NtrC family response regulator